jgi:hypothetical protein
MSQDPQRWISYKALSEVAGTDAAATIERICFLNACRRARPTTDDIEIFRNRKRRKNLPPLGHLTQPKKSKKPSFKPGGWNPRMSATAKKKSAYMALGFALAALLRGPFAARFDWLATIAARGSRRSACAVSGPFAPTATSVCRVSPCHCVPMCLLDRDYFAPLSRELSTTSGIIGTGECVTNLLPNMSRTSLSNDRS